MQLRGCCQSAVMSFGYQFSLVASCMQYYKSYFLICVTYFTLYSVLQCDDGASCRMFESLDGHTPCECVTSKNTNTQYYKSQQIIFLIKCKCKSYN